MSGGSVGSVGSVGSILSVPSETVFSLSLIHILQEASGEDLIQPQVKIHLAQILFILRTVIRAETDGITEIVNGKARHGGVQINDANALVAFPVN